MRSRTSFTELVAAAAAAALLGCSSGDKPARTEQANSAATAPAAVAAGQLPRPVPGAQPGGATQGMLVAGDSIFHGLIATGSCHVCHGADARGTVLAPPLTGEKWLTGDGSYDFIERRVMTGWPTPVPPYSCPMLPMGGVALTSEQIKAVAAYVFSISHKRG